MTMSNKFESYDHCVRVDVNASWPNLSEPLDGITGDYRIVFDIEADPIMVVYMFEREDDAVFFKLKAEWSI